MLSKKDLVKDLKDLDNKLASSQIDVTAAYHNILKLEKIFDQQQGINIFHMPFGFGTTSLINARPLQHYIDHAQKLAIRANKRYNHGYRQLIKLAQKGLKLSQSKRNDNPKLWNAYEYIKGIVDIKHYMAKGYNGKKQLYFVNLFGIQLVNNKVHQDVKLQCTLMPLTAGFLRCMLRMDLIDLTKGTLDQELKDIQIKTHQPKQESLL